MKVNPLAGLEAFVAVARQQSFRAGALELGVTPSAVSQAIRLLEERLGVRLFHRTTRSMTLTEAGRAYFERVKPAYLDLVAASEGMSSLSTQAVGTLRLNMPRIGYDSLIAPHLAEFLAEFPKLQLDIDVDDNLVNIVDRGYDAGLRIGEYLEKDMIAVKLGGYLSSALVASPAYFRRFPAPVAVSDLRRHNCINFRYYNDRSLYRWELEEGGKEVIFEARGNLTVNDSSLAVRAALDGVGIAYVLDLQVRDLLEKKKLVRVLTKQSPRFPGFFLYYPSRKNVPVKLQEFIHYFKAKCRG